MSKGSRLCLNRMASSCPLGHLLLMGVAVAVPLQSKLYDPSGESALQLSGSTETFGDSLQSLATELHNIMEKELTQRQSAALDASRTYRESVMNFKEGLKNFTLAADQVRRATYQHNTAMAAAIQSSLREGLSSHRQESD
mmetsp:Transcript_35264/g.64501  ORF Transcript_35264/g.64501 Transcript_35264/m.64501 type:complete len:140 (+) Transcript_35264:52-471(+)